MTREIESIAERQYLDDNNISDDIVIRLKDEIDQYGDGDEQLLTDAARAIETLRDQLAQALAELKQNEDIIEHIYKCSKCNAFYYDCDERSTLVNALAKFKIDNGTSTL